MSRTRNNAYRAARRLGDVEAAMRGPAPLAKRVVRKAVYKKTNGLTRRLLRTFGL